MGEMVYPPNVFSATADRVVSKWNRTFQRYLGYPTRMAIQSGFTVLVFRDTMPQTPTGWVQPTEGNRPKRHQVLLWRGRAHPEFAKVVAEMAALYIAPDPVREIDGYVWSEATLWLFHYTPELEEWLWREKVPFILRFGQVLAALTLDGVGGVPPTVPRLADAYAAVWVGVVLPPVKTATTAAFTPDPTRKWAIADWTVWQRLAGNFSQPTTV